MDKKLFENIDNIKVPEKTKAELFEKVQEQKQRQTEPPKKESWFARSKWLVTGIAIGAVCMMLAIPLLNSGVDYQQYVKAASTEVAEPYEALLKEKKALKEKLQKGEITLEEFLEQYDALQAKALELQEQQKHLNEKYGIDVEKLDATTKKATKDEKDSINAYMLTLSQLEAEDDELDALEEQLEADYKNGKITREQFVREMSKLEEREEALDKQEEALESDGDDDDDDDDSDDDD